MQMLESDRSKYVRRIVLVLVCFAIAQSVVRGQSPDPCNNPAARAFDWQLGTWQSEDGRQVHEIRFVAGNCVIQETWKTDGKETAVALKSFDGGRHDRTGAKKWLYSWTALDLHQLWEGRDEAGQWRFYRRWYREGQPVLSRTYWNAIDADRLVRIVEQSTDDGLTWKPWVSDPFVRLPELSVRNGHAVAFHPDLGKTVLFGGANSNRVLNDTWAFDGSGWSPTGNSKSPPARTFPAMIYDPLRKKILLFGGNRVLFGKTDPEILDDFWEFDGAAWKQVSVPVPDGRAEASITFDIARGKAVLFGGYRFENGAIKALGDTWEWDGSVWKKVADAGPAPRSGAAIAYDPTRRRTVLFGGGIRSGGAHETWEWDGIRWREIRSATSEPRYNSVMAYHSIRRRIVRFGGWNGTSRVAETWEYDGRKWTKLNIVNPAPRNHSAMTFDSLRNKIVLFGGHDGEFVFGDTWEFDGRQWIRVIGTDPQLRLDNSH